MLGKELKNIKINPAKKEHDLTLRSRSNLIELTKICMLCFPLTHADTYPKAIDS